MILQCRRRASFLCCICSKKMRSQQREESVALHVNPPYGAPLDAVSWAAPSPLVRQERLQQAD